MAVNDEVEIPAQKSHLFMLRIWPEEGGGLTAAHTGWRGKVQHVNSGEVRYFRDWPALEAFVEGLVQKGLQSDRLRE